ncbi:MAG: sigma-70 family RNA polymerase sigma factor [Myxococcota bacterium]
MDVDPSQVLRDHAGALARVAASYAPPGSDRDDLRQDIALAILKALPRFRGESSLRTYIMRIAHNCGIRHSVRRRRRAEVAEVEVSSDANVESAIDARRRSDVLAEAIRTLPIGARQVLVLALEDMSHAEIADVLGIRENAVSVRLHRAREALRKRLHDPSRKAAAHG